MPSQFSILLKAREEASAAYMLFLRYIEITNFWAITLYSENIQVFCMCKIGCACHYLYVTKYGGEKKGGGLCVQKKIY